MDEGNTESTPWNYVGEIMVDLYRSRRGKFYRCQYWSRKTSGVMDNEELIHSTTPSGVFYAKISSSKFNDTRELAGLQYGTESISIETEDIVEINKNDLIQFKGDIWLVGRVNTDPLQKNSEFSSRESNKTYIELFKGF